MLGTRDRGMIISRNYPIRSPDNSILVIRGTIYIARTAQGPPAIFGPSYFSNVRSRGRGLNAAHPTSTGGLAPHLSLLRSAYHPLLSADVLRQIQTQGTIKTTPRLIWILVNVEKPLRGLGARKRLRRVQQEARRHSQGGPSCVSFGEDHPNFLHGGTCTVSPLI